MTFVLFGSYATLIAKLNLILKNQGTIMAVLDPIAASIATLSADFTTLTKDVNALVGQGGPPSLAQVQVIVDAVNAMDASVKALDASVNPQPAAPAA